VHLSAAAHRVLRTVEAAREATGHAVTRARGRSLASSNTVWTTLRGRSLAACPVDSFDGRTAIAGTLAEICAALAEAGIAYETAATEPPSIAVPATPWPAVVRALAPLELSAQQGAALGPLSRLRARPGAVRVFRPWATSGGRYLAGPDVGVDLVPGSAPPPVPGLGDIDAVFTWVDGSDPAWQEKKRRRLKEMGRAPLHETAANDARYAQIDELRYALRAVARYAPWLRRTFLVTDGQRPPWLEDEYPHVTLVRHDEIFSDPAALPTFNSHAIESRLHHIPGLAERYLYVNDDIFLGHYLHPTDFFTESGLPRLFPTHDAIPDGPVSPKDRPVVAAAKNNSNLLRTLAGTRATHTLKHTPFAMQRSVAFELEGLAEDRFRETERAPFRSATDLSVCSSLLPYYGLGTGRAVKGTIRHFYSDVASEELAWRLPRLLERRDADIICLNATTDPATCRTEAIRGFLESYFPPLG
jgi:hypothetical protein